MFASCPMLPGVRVRRLQTNLPRQRIVDMEIRIGKGGGVEGGDGGRYSPVFEKMMKKKLALPASQIALQRAARDKEASTDYSNTNPRLSPMKKRKRIGGLF